jgi:hypothetical protein
MAELKATHEQEVLASGEERQRLAEEMQQKLEE